MDLSLTGKVALVGGASQGIGFAIARLLAAEGASVAMVARKVEPLQDACLRIADQTRSVTFAAPGDIRDGADCDSIVRRVTERFGRIDILVNNDGAPPLGEIESFDDVAWGRAIEQNLMSVVRLSRGALPSMRANGWGRIVNITALSALQPLPRFGLSVATWAAVIGYAKTLALETASAGITVNTICPGRIETSRLGTVFGGGARGVIDDEQKAKLRSEIPMGRIGQADEIAGLVAFLCSGWAAYLTGATHHVDGGRRASLI